MDGLFKGSCRHCGETRTWPADLEFPERAQPGMGAVRYTQLQKSSIQKGVAVSAKKRRKA